MPTVSLQLGSEFQINTTTTDEQIGSSVSALSNGGFVVTWQSAFQDGDGTGIYAQRYNAAGDPVGSEFQVNTTTTEDQSTPSIVGLDGGGFVIMWHSFGQDGSNNGVYGQMYTNGGGTVGTEFLVNTTTADTQQDASVTALPGGGFVAVWASVSNDGDGSGVFGQVFDAAGAPVGVEFQVNTETVSSQFDADVAVLSDGGFVVSWTSFLQDSDSNGVYAQRYDASGVAAGGEFLVNTRVLDAEGDSSVTGLASGGFVVTWESQGQDGSSFGVYAQVFDAAGAPVGVEFIVNSTTAGTQDDPVVTALADGGFVIVWEDSGQDGSGFGIFGQRYDASGAEIGTEFLINTEVSNFQIDPVVTAFDDGGFVVTWESFDQDGSGYGIYGQRFEAQLFGTSAGETIEDTLQANWIEGRDGDDFLFGGNGEDSIYGGKGSDEIFGGNGADTLFGGNNNDEVNGRSGDDTMNGGRGNDVLNGAGGADIMDGDQGNDTLRGGGGQDVITGGAGNDRLTGGDGNDVFVFGDNFGNDKITDYNALKNAEDIDFSGNTEITSFNDLINNHAVQVGSKVVITDGANTLTLLNVDIADLGAGDFIF